MKISAGRTPVAAAASAAVRFTASAPVLPVKAFALPELTTSARALPRPSRARHQSTGAEAHFDVVKTPAISRTLVEQREHHIGAALVADSGRAGREAHAFDGGNIGIAFGGERRNFGRRRTCKGRGLR